MANNVLASMVISLGLESKGVTTGINEANRSLLQFQGSADKLKGVNLSSLKANFDKQITALATLRQQAKEYQKALNFAKSETEIKALNRQLDQTYAEMNRIKGLGRQNLVPGAKPAAAGMDKLGGSANMVNMEFARIIQDAPYGMMGIGNNIQQLTANFGQLQRQAGSTGGAIKAALASMITPAAGLTLGIALLTSGITMYQQWSQRSAKSTEEAAKAMKSAEQAADEYVDALDGLTKARVRGDRDAQKELTTLRLLYKQTQNTALSTKERVKAVDELQKQYPDYFESLKDEDVLAGKAADAYDRLSKSILATARAQAARQLITDKASLQLVNKQQIADLEVQLEKQKEEMAKAASLEGISKQQLAKESFATITAGRIAPIREGIDATEKQIADLRAQNARLQKEMLNLEGIAGAGLITEEKGKKDKEQRNYLKELVEGWNLATKQADLFGVSYDELGVKADLLKATMVGLMEQGLKPQNSLIISLKSTYDLFASETLPKTQTAIDRFAKTDLSKLRNEITSIAQVLEMKSLEIKPPSADFLKLYNRDVLEALKAQVEIDMEVVGTAARQAFADSIGNIAELIGQSLAGQPINAGSFVKAVLMPFADLAIQLGTYAIGVGLGIGAIKKALASMNPAVAIAAGAALITLGSAVKAGLSNMASGGGGGGGFGGGSLSGRAYAPPQPNGGFSTAYEGPDQIELFVRRDTLVAFMEQGNYKTRRQRG